MFAALTWRRFRVTVTMIAIVAAAVWAYEFRVLQRPSLKAVVSSSGGSNEIAAPIFGLANVSFLCAETQGIVTSVQVSGPSATATCTTGFTDATTRCASFFPMMGYGEQIKCATGEAIRCAGKPLQALGLFKEDSYCGDVSDRDMGPPGDANRSAD